MFTEKIISNKQVQLLILLFIALALNINTLFNEYAVDDAIVLTDNTFVEKGLKGIPEIFSQDYLKGLNGLDAKELSGGRYRPLGLSIFALEHQFFGENPMVSHLINILLFVLLIALLYKLLHHYVFRNQDNNLAFITCLLFVVHPIHTEVIANVKSRDELIAFILLIVSLIALIKHSEKRTTGFLFIGLLCFFLALLTKESSVAFVGVFPLILYFFYFHSIKKSLLLAIPLLLVFIAYLTLRFLVIGFSISSSDNILNMPFLFATASEAFATKIFILIKYIGLLMFPYPLSSDYSYNQIPYIEIYSFSFILSLLTILGLIAFAIYTFRKRSLFSFCILYFFATIFLVTNLVVDIGAPLAERLLFQPSLAFCILLAALFIKVKISFRLIANATLFSILLLFSVKTIRRNAEWKNNETLYFADLTSAPNSLRINSYAAEQYVVKAKFEPNAELKNEYYKKAVFYGERALKIYSKDPFISMNLGSAYFGLLDYYRSADLWIQAYKLKPDEPEAKKALDFSSTVLYKQGNSFLEKGNVDDAIKCFLKSTELNSNNVEAWYNLGGIYFLKNDSINGMKSWNIVKKLDPNHQFKKEEFLNY